MPSKSKAQHNLMDAVAHNPKFAKKVGIPQSVGKDFAKADKGKKFNNGGVAKSLKKAGFYEEGKSKSERLKIVSNTTTKPQRLEMVDKLFLAKKMKEGGLYANINAKRKRIEAGSGERMRKVGSKDAPKSSDFVNSTKTVSYKEGGKSTVNAAGNYTKPGLRKRIFNNVKSQATAGTGAGKWSARKAQVVAKRYKDAGGGYRD